MLITPRAEALFNEALTLEPEQRAAFIEKTCGNDQALSDEVNSLLTAANESEAYFDQLSGQVGLSALADDVELAAQDKIIGQWRLKHLIGRGGMGSVYLAERADGQFEKLVALKTLPIGLNNDQAVARFLMERQILARLVHDNIARLLDGGVTEDGTPYFVMDYVKGTRIDAYCEEQELTVNQRLRLVLDVARGVQYAHRNLIIHRDLKPTNLLVEENGNVRLLDFGIAKVLEPTANEQDLTQVANRPVTPAYASPEMLRGEAVDVTSDVYSIGVILYQLLTGRLPLNFEGMSLAETYQHAENTQPPPASQFNKSVNSEIDAIIGKALAKLPAERYESVQSLAQDLRNHLDGLPVAAKAPSAWYRSKKFINRHRVSVFFSTLVVLGLAAFAAFATQSAITSERQSRVIALERDRAEATKNFLISIFDAAGPSVDSATLTAKEILDAGRDRINTELADQPALQVDLMETIGAVYSSMGLVSDWYDVLLDLQPIVASQHGEQSAEYLVLLDYLSMATDHLGDYDASENYGNQALVLSLKLNDLKGEAAARGRIGRVAHLKGDYEVADREYHHSLTLLQQSVGEEHTLTAQTKLNLATLLSHQGKNQEAYDLLKEVEATKRRLGEFENSIPTDLYLTIGRTLNELDRRDEAIEIYEYALEANTQLYGPDYSYNMYLINGLGKIHEDMGNYPMAVQRYVEARTMIEKHMPGSPNEGRGNSNVGRAYQLSGQCDEAIPALQTAKNLFEQFLPDHWFLGEANWRLGACLTTTGNYAVAEPLILAGLALLTDKWQKKPDEIERARSAAADLYEAWGKPQQAEQFR